MVKRSILEKMSNAELEKYIRPDSPFVYKAIEIAYDILKERNYNFSEIDKNRIKELVRIKKEEDLKLVKINTWDINAEVENTSIKLYSQKSIWYFSIFFGVHIGSILLAVNLVKTYKGKKAFIVTLFGIIYILLMYIVYIVAKIYLPDYYILIFIFTTAGGASILQFYFWDRYLSNIKYKKRSVVMPLVICIVIYFLVFIIINFLI